MNQKFYFNSLFLNYFILNRNTKNVRKKEEKKLRELKNKNEINYQIEYIKVFE